jgi:hypothetical protein
MKSFTFRFFLLVAGIILKVLKCSTISNPHSPEDLIKDKAKVDIAFKLLLGSPPIIVKLTSLFENSQIGARKTLALAILASLVKCDPRLFTEQFVLMGQEGNQHFNDFVNQKMLTNAESFNGGIRISLVDNKDLTLKRFLLEQGLFEFILKRGKFSIVEPIIKDVEAMAKVLCAEKLELISNFLNYFPQLEPFESKQGPILYEILCQVFIDRIGPLKAYPSKVILNENDAKKWKNFYDKVSKQKFGGERDISIVEFGYNLEEINLFKSLVRLITNGRSTETVTFIKANFPLIKGLLGSPKAEIVINLREKGLFFVLANYFTDGSVQRILRILDARIRVQCSSPNIDFDRLDRFWPSLSILKDFENIEYLGMILLKYSFNQKNQSDGIFSEIKESEFALIKSLVESDIAILNQWQMEFNGFISPNFLYNPLVNLLFRDIGLSINEITPCIFGHAMYISFIEGIPFYKVFNQMKSAYDYPGSEKIFGLEDKGLLQISKLDSFTDVYCTLNTQNEYSSHKGAINRYFLQHVAAYKTERKAFLLEACLKEMNSRSSLMITSKDSSKWQLDVVQKVIHIIVKAYLGEGKITIKDADFLSNLAKDDQSSVIKWLNGLCSLFIKPLVVFENLYQKPRYIYDVLSTLCPDKE